MDPKLKKSQEGNAGERIYFETKYKTPFSQSVHVQRSAKGRNDILPFHPQNCPLTHKIDSARSSKKGNSLHSIVKGMVG